MEHCSKTSSPHCVPSLCVWQLEGGEKRTVLRLAPLVAPVKAVVLPLVKNNADIMAKAHEIFDIIRNMYVVAFNVTSTVFSCAHNSTMFCVGYLLLGWSCVG